MPSFSGYPLDLSGVASSNLITNETVTFTQESDRVFIPAAGNFYADGLVVRDAATNRILAPVVEYKALNLNSDASMASGLEVDTVLYVFNPAVNGVILQYQCVGGIYSDASLIQEMLSSVPLPNPLINWGHIIGQPIQFPPSAHLHNIDEIYNLGGLANAVEAMRQAILAGDGPAFQAAYQYFNNILANTYATQAQLTTAIDAIHLPYIQVVDTYAALRAMTGMPNIGAGSDTIYMVVGKSSVTDGQGRLFVWNYTSMVSDDDNFTIQPTVVNPGSPGRFTSILKVEQDLIAEATARYNEDVNLQNQINVIDATLAQNGVGNDLVDGPTPSVLPNSTNLDAWITVGEFYFDVAAMGITGTIPQEETTSTDSSGTPDITITPSYSVLTHGILRVARLTTNQVTQIVTSTDTDASYYIRTSHNPGSGLVWSPWNQLMSAVQVDAAVSRALAAIIDAAPSMLDTVNKLAAAIGNDPTFYNDVLYAANLVTTLATNDATKPAASSLTYSLAVNKLNISDIEDDLTGNGIVTKPLSANQGYLLNQRLKAAGINIDLSNNVLATTTDFDSVTTVGKYSFIGTNTYTHNPCAWGTLEVERYDNTNITQRVSSAQADATMFIRTFWAAAWGPWIQLATTVDVAAALSTAEAYADSLLNSSQLAPCTAGIVVHNNETLCFCAVADDNSPTNAYAYISGVYTAVNIATITNPYVVTPSGSVPGLYYAYVGSNGSGGYELFVNQTAPVFDTSVPLNKRKVITMTGDATKTFIGMAYYSVNALGIGVWVARNWFNDTGFLQHKVEPVYLSGLTTSPQTVTGPLVNIPLQVDAKLTQFATTFVDTTFGSGMNHFTFLAWPGEVVEAGFDGSFLIDNGGTPDTSVIAVETIGQTGGPTKLGYKRLSSLGLSGAAGSNFWQGLNIGDKFISTTADAYKLYLNVSSALSISDSVARFDSNSNLYVKLNGTNNLATPRAVYVTPPITSLIVDLNYNSYEVDLHSAFTSVYGSPTSYPSLRHVIFRVDSGVTLGSFYNATAAMFLNNTGDWAVGTNFNIVNYGNIIGKGGDGGDGGQVRNTAYDGGFYVYAAAQPGQDGGDAISVFLDVTIFNFGILGGGGGGGAGGGGSWAAYGTAVIAEGPGGAGGAGSLVGYPGANGNAPGGTYSVDEYGGVPINPGAASLYTGGSGIPANTSFANTTREHAWGGQSGNGGNLGQPGGGGSDGTRLGDGGSAGGSTGGLFAGGAAGYAVRYNGQTVTLNNYGTIYGSTA